MRRGHAAPGDRPLHRAPTAPVGRAASPRRARLSAAWRDPRNEWRLLAACFLVACLAAGATALGATRTRARLASHPKAGEAHLAAGRTGSVVGAEAGADPTFRSRAR